MTTPSPPSSPPSPASGPRRSTTSWTIPQPADVISYAYLWAREAAKGLEEGAKDRPAVVVIARTVRNGQTELLVAPVTHSAPSDPATAVEMPPRVKRHLGLDDQRSWIVTTELNRFTWPGPDIRVAPGRETPVYDAIPARLFEQVRAAVTRHVTADRLRLIKREE